MTPHGHILFTAVRGTDLAAACATLGFERHALKRHNLQTVHQLRGGVVVSSEVFYFHFEKTSTIRDFTRAWHRDKWHGTPPTWRLMRVTFRNRELVLAAVNGAPIALDYKSEVSGMTPVADTNLVAALLTMNFRLHTAHPVQRVMGARGVPQHVFFFEQHAQLPMYFGAWRDQRFHINNPEHPFSYVKAALSNYIALDNERKQAQRMHVFKHGNVARLIPERKMTNAIRTDNRSDYARDGARAGIIVPAR